jgi:hypothetical protein
LKLWRWRMHGINGKLYTTRYVMTEAEALQLDPQGQRVQASLEARQVPETANEHQRASIAGSALRWSGSLLRHLRRRATCLQGVL